MEVVQVEDTRQRLTVDIRILSEKKKSSFRTARVKGFPVTETCEEFRKEVQNILPGEKLSPTFTFGFIDKKQKKNWVVSDGDLAGAYAAAVSGQAIWVDPGHTAVTDEVMGSHGKLHSSKSQANKRKHKFPK